MLRQKLSCWSHGQIGETISVIAAQSVGEPNTIDDENIPRRRTARLEQETKHEASMNRTVKYAEDMRILKTVRAK